MRWRVDAMSSSVVSRVVGSRRPMLSKRATCGARPPFGLCSIISQVLGMATLRSSPVCRQASQPTKGRRTPISAAMTFAPGRGSSRPDHAVCRGAAEAPASGVPYGCPDRARAAQGARSSRPRRSRWVAGRATIGGAGRVFTTLGRHRRLFRSWLPSPEPCCFGTCTYPGRRGARGAADGVSTAPHPTSGHSTCLSPGKAGLTAPPSPLFPNGDHARRLTVRQRLLLGATDELHARKVVTSRALEAAQRLELDQRETIELCMLVGHYEMLAMTLNSLGVEPERAALAALDGSTTADRRPTSRPPLDAAES